jgi:hypothetical protein
MTNKEDIYKERWCNRCGEEIMPFPPHNWAEVGRNIIHEDCLTNDERAMRERLNGLPSQGSGIAAELERKKFRNNLPWNI